MIVRASCLPIMAAASMIPSAAAAASAALPDKESLASMAQNLLKDLGGSNGNFYSLFIAIMILIGVILVITGVAGFTRQDTPKGGAVVTIMIGSLLIGFPAMLDIMTVTMFNKQAAMSILGEGDTSGGSQLSLASQMFVNLSVFLVQVVGYLALYRGLKTMADVSLTRQRQPEATKSAIIFIVMGILCINILWTLQLIAASMGTEGAKYYDMMFGHLTK